VLVVADPGQLGALHRNPGLVMRPDYEVPISATVDYLVTRPDVDTERLAIVGYSVGGYLAPLAAAFEPRLKACVSNGFMHDSVPHAQLARRRPPTRRPSTAPGSRAAPCIASSPA
jgi:cephalosporin-C deacetylase-like acetyl esterase